MMTSYLNWDFPFQLAMGILTLIVHFINNTSMSHGCQPPSGSHAVAALTCELRQQSQPSSSISHGEALQSKRDDASPIFSPDCLLALGCTQPCDRHNLFIRSRMAKIGL